MTHNKIITAPPLDGVSASIFCVVDEKYRIRHHFKACRTDEEDGDPFPFLETPDSIVDNPILNDVIHTRSAVSMVLSYGGGRRKFIYILPYEHKKGKWRFACKQVVALPPDPDAMEYPFVSALMEERVCLLLVDSTHAIRSVGSHVPASFGYTSEALAGLTLPELFKDSDLHVLLACAADSNESILGYTFSCVDDSGLEVEIKKFSATDKYTLYWICDVSPCRRVEEFAEVAARERRRIGQDLHDSIGQTLTGMSLLSQSLSNTLEREGCEGSGDAAQISELANEASNQIRQISRGLMPAEIVRHGLYESLRELARLTTDACGIACETRLDDSIKFTDVAVEAHLYRIAQEAVNNAVRHAQASRIDIIVSENDGMSQLDVVDNGRWVESAENIVGIGLKTMEYRAAAIGGQLHVGTSPQGGTQMTCRLDIDESLATKV